MPGYALKRFAMSAAGLRAKDGVAVSFLAGHSRTFRFDPALRDKRADGFSVLSRNGCMGRGLAYLVRLL
jgi:hypothetical protein